MQPKIVAIVGQAGSGKDTVAEYLLKKVYGTSLAFADPMKEFCLKVFEFSREQLWGSSEFRNAIDHRYDKDQWSNRDALRQRFNDNRYNFIAGLAPETGCEDLDIDNLSNALSSFTEWFQGLMELDAISPRIVLQSMGTQFGRKVLGADIWVNVGIQRAQKPLADGRWVVIRDCRFVNEARLISAAGGEIWRISRPIDRSQSFLNHESELEQFSSEMTACVNKEISNTGTLDDLYWTVDQIIAPDYNLFVAET